MYIKVRVYPKSKKEELKKIKDNKFEVKVKEKAERNMANKAVIRILSNHFGINKNKIKIINGHQSPSKMLSVDVDML